MLYWNELEGQQVLRLRESVASGGVLPSSEASSLWETVPGESLLIKWGVPRIGPE